MTERRGAGGTWALGVALVATVVLGVTANQAFAGGDQWLIFAAGNSFVAGAEEEVGQGATGTFNNSATENHNVIADDNGPDGKPFPHPDLRRTR